MFPNDLSPVLLDLASPDTEDLLNEVIFRPDTDLLKNFFMFSITKPEQAQNRSPELKETNPSNKLYFVGLKLKDYFYKRNPGSGPDFAFLGEISICVLSQFPFFEFHRKIIMYLTSKRKKI